MEMPPFEPSLAPHHRARKNIWFEVAAAWKTAGSPPRTSFSVRQPPLERPGLDWSSQNSSFDAVNVKFACRLVTPVTVRPVIWRSVARARRKKTSASARPAARKRTGKAIRAEDCLRAMRDSDKGGRQRLGEGTRAEDCLGETRDGDKG